MIWPVARCLSCDGNRFLCTGSNPSDIDACKPCAAAAEIDYRQHLHARQTQPKQLAMVLQFSERRAA